MDCTPKPPTIPDLVPEVTMDARSARRMAVVLSGILLPMVAAGFLVQASTESAPVAVVTVSLSQATEGHLVEIRDSRGAVVLSGEFRSRVDSLGNIEKDAELAGPQGQTVIGEVELEFPAAGREHRRPELEVDVIHLQPRQRYSVVIDDRIVGTFVTDDRGSADLELQEGETLVDRAAGAPFSSQ
jgi:hypothetical protein